ncbi:MAG: LytR C-terminal domain-containing protein, partial [Actinomycetota bacterium]|nr:LytR C-terminal domain-containing protein [Actinomycetota bacterium]
AAAGMSAPPAPRAPGPAGPGTASANGAPNGQETQSIAAVDAGGPVMPHRGVPAAPHPPGLPPVASPGLAPPPIGPPTDDNPVPLRQVSPVAGAPRRGAGAEVWPPAEEESAGRPSGRTIATVLAVTTAVLLVALLLTQVLGSGGDDPVRSTSAPTASTSTDNEFVPPSSGETDTATPPVVPGDYSVYVLNGTQQNGIAAEAGKTLETEGYRIAGKGNAAVNTATTTEVYYVKGKKRGASAVAKKLDVAAANVKEADQAVAVQGQNADVIVQIGTDKATP